MQLWEVRVWAAVAPLKPGEPVFRPIDKGQRMDAGIKARIRALAIAGGKSEGDAAAMAEHVSGHSPRAGYATPAAAADVPSASSGCPPLTNPTVLPKGHDLLSAQLSAMGKGLQSDGRARLGGALPLGHSPTAASVCAFLCLCRCSLGGGASCDMPFVSLR